MSVLSSLMLIFSSILFVSSFNLRQIGNDNMCKVKGGILCVKDELMIIATTAKGIARTANDIEQNIQQTTKNLETLNRHVNIEMNYTHSSLPISYFHTKFFHLNNINKEYLTELFREAHNAMIYYSHSIDELLQLQGVFGEKTDDWFKQIKIYLKDDIICRYRTVLDNYSQKWIPAHDIGELQFSRKHRLSPSLVHNVHSVVIARYLKEWMEVINSVIINLEMKFF